MADKQDKCQKGKVVDTWETGDSECDAYSERYECGGVYHHNYMDVVGCRDHDCFWDCRECKRISDLKAEKEELHKKLQQHLVTDSDFIKGLQRMNEINLELMRLEGDGNE